MSDTAAIEDPVAYFLDEMAYHGKRDRTLEAYERVLRRFEASLAADGERPETADRRDCFAWIHGLRGEVSPSTVATYASYLHRFYAYMARAGEFDANPMALVMEELDESIETDPTRRDISVERMRSFVSRIGHPLDYAVIVTFLKTGVRVGELCNLDRRDCHLDDSWVKSVYSDGIRGSLDGRSDSLFVAPDVDRGAVVNGEKRTATNKRQRPTIIPVDGELKAALRRWLAIRPESPSPAEPLFVSTRDARGERLTPEMVRNIVRRHAREVGWYRTGGGPEENVTPHYFRHFFTTHLRDRTGDRGIVKYLRGDVADDVIDTYTHHWGDRVREVYEGAIYSLA